MEGKATLVDFNWKTPALVNRGPFLVVLAFVISLTLGWILYNVNRESSEEVLVVDDAHLSFGEVLEQGDFEWKLPITNRSSSPVSIERFDTNCRCARLEPKSLNIGPGERAQVTVHVDTKLPPPRSKAESERVRLDVQLVPRIAGQKVLHSRGWHLDGWVRRTFQLSQYAVEFGTYSDDSTPPTKTITIRPAIPVEGFSVACSNAVTASVFQDVHAKSYTLRCVPNPTLLPGPFHSNIALAPVCHTAGKWSSIIIPVIGTKTSLYNVVPSALELGVRTVGDIVTDTVLLDTAGNPCEIIEIGASDHGASIVPLGDKSTARHVFRVTQTIVKSGRQSHVVVFTLRTPSGAAKRTGLAISYLGVDERKATTSSSRHAGFLSGLTAFYNCLTHPKESER